MDLTVSYQYNKLDVINFVLDSYSFEKVRCSLILILNSSLFVVGIVSLFFNQIPMGIFLILFAIVYTLIGTKEIISFLNIYVLIIILHYKILLLSMVLLNNTT